MCYRGASLDAFKNKYANAAYVFQPKYDGWRALIYQGRAISKEGKDITKYLDDVPNTTVRLDCEVVAVEEWYEDTTLFNARLPVRTGHNAVRHYAPPSKLTYFAFDIPLSAADFGTRRARLEEECAKFEQLKAAPYVFGFPTIFDRIVGYPEAAGHTEHDRTALEGVIIRRANAMKRQPVAFKKTWITKPSLTVDANFNFYTQV